jgi:hypothetical protein
VAREILALRALGVYPDAAALHSVRLADAVVDEEDGVVVGWHARQSHGEAGGPVSLRGEAVRLTAPSIGVNVTGFVSKWFSNRL